MDINLEISQASAYKSPSQLARVVTESWFSENMYCPTCPSDGLEQTPANEKVVDFVCLGCDSSFQLKALSHRFGRTVADGAYQPKIDMIRNGTAPNWFFMQYDRDDWLVENLVLVPAHFVTPGIVQKRKPLSDSARRHGWVGSNIILDKLPLDGRISIIRNRREVPKARVRESWQRFEFLRKKSLETRGWLNDILLCVRTLGKEFTLDDVYAFENRLAVLHPDNRHVRAKIRQQLQVLRDNGILNFISPGKYKLKG
jgi:type II restriction enzyme